MGKGLIVILDNLSLMVSTSISVETPSTLLLRNSLILGLNDGSARRYSIPTLRFEFTYKLTTAPVTALAISDR